MCISDADLLHVLLDRFGWVKEPVAADNAEFWFRTADDMRRNAFGIVVPTNKSKSDYDDLVSKALSTMRRIHGREYDNELGLLHAEFLMALDPIEIREDTGVTNGMIHWRSGSHLITTMEGMLKASAKASVVKERYFGNSQSVVSESVVKGTYMGQTKIGSYIVTAYVPSAQPFAITESKDEKASIQKSVSGRAITSSMRTALHAFDEATREVLKSDSETAYGVFDEAVNDGVSCELLSAISNLSADNETQITISFARPKGEPAERYEIVIQPDVHPVVERAQAYLRLPEKATSCHIIGEIVGLKHDSSKRNYEITMKTLGKELPSTVKVFLSAEDYIKAVETHGDGKLFELTGVIHRYRRGTTVSDVSFAKNTGISISSDAPDSEAMTREMRNSIRNGQGLLEWD